MGTVGDWVRRQQSSRLTVGAVGFVTSGALSGVIPTLGITSIYYLLRRHVSRPDAEVPIGPRGRDTIAQGKARNERRPGFAPPPDLTKPCKGETTVVPHLQRGCKVQRPPRPAVAFGSLRPGLSYPGPLGLKSKQSLWVMLRTSLRSPNNFAAESHLLAVLSHSLEPVIDFT